MYTPPTCRDSSNAISSPASAAGRSRFVVPDGHLTDLFGPVPVLANLSARQAKALGLLTSGTSGRTSTTSSVRTETGAASRSAALQSFLESRLRARTQTLGSTLYALTWKPWVTPSQRSRSRLRASVRRTSEIAITGWATPTAALAEKGVRTFEGGLLEAMRNHGPDLAAQACLAGWVTPTTRDWKDTPGMVAQRDGKDRNDQLPRQAYLCGWPTPTANSKDQPESHRGLETLAGCGKLAGWPTPMAGTPAQNGNNAAGNNDSSRKTVDVVSWGLAGWGTPTAQDDNQSRMSRAAMEREWNRPGASQSNLAKQAAMLSSPARLTACGEMLTGSTAAMPSGGQLRPGHSRWLMGYPVAWDRAAPSWRDWQAWQDLITQVSRAPKPTESAPCADTETPSTPSRPLSSSES